MSLYTPVQGIAAFLGDGKVTFLSALPHVFTGNVEIGGAITLTGGIEIGGDVELGDAAADTITIKGQLVLEQKASGGSLGTPIDVTNVRQYGFEFYYGGNDYDVSAGRFRGILQTTDAPTRTAQGLVIQASNSDGIDANVVQGALIESIGKSSTSAATISTMRGALIGSEWGAFDTVTALNVAHVRVHTRNSAGAGSFGTGYGLLVENEAVGGNGQALDAGIYFKDTNISGGLKAFDYGVDFLGGTYTVGCVRFPNEVYGLVGRNAAGGADVNLLKINSDNLLETGVGAIFGGNLKAPSTGKLYFNTTSTYVGSDIANALMLKGYTTATLEASNNDVFLTPASGYSVKAKRVLSLQSVTGLSSVNIKSITEDVVIGVGIGVGTGGVVSATDLAPENSLILGVSYAVVTPDGGGTVANLDIGRTGGGNLDEFIDIDKIAPAGLGDSGTSFEFGDGTITSGVINVAADTFTLTTDVDVTVSAMTVRVVTYYMDLTVPGIN